MLSSLRRWFETAHRAGRALTPARLARATAALLAIAAASCGDTFECSPGGTSCDGRCVSLETHAGHCGLCGFRCGSADYCESADCKTYCGPGRSLCQGHCLATTSDPERCGGCSQRCAEGLYCDAGECSESCSGELCSSPHGPRCAHLESDAEHCGSCGNACAEGEWCSEGQCLRACPEGREACGDDCVDLQRDPEHCGRCDSICDSGVSCQQGICGGPAGCEGEEECVCPDGQLVCAEACVDPKSDAHHCGGCDRPCPAGQQCTDGSCGCAQGQALCGEACIDVTGDDRNCGGCGLTCQDDSRCRDGACECPGELTYCAGSCVDTASSQAHCGACGQPCSGPEQCLSGTCFHAADDECGGRARGATITKLSWYQAVEVPLYRSGVLVRGAERSATLVAGKDSILRVHVETSDDFSPRQLSARLWLTEPGQAATLLYQKRPISADSRQAQLSSTFAIAVPAVHLGTETSFHVELVECSSGAEGEQGTTRVPVLGTAPLEARTTGPIRVHFVPIRFNGLLPDTSAQTLAIYTTDALRKFPTTALEPTLLPVLEGGNGVPNMDELLGDLEVRRANDVAADDVYYYGLVRSHSNSDAYCAAAGSSGCTLGIAYLPRAPSEQVALGIAYADLESAVTFSHELGHGHGRDHAPSGGVDGADPRYPHAEGKIGVWGLEVATGELKNPAAYYDFMGYAEPNWTSEYTWNAIAEVVAATNHAPLARRRPAAPSPWDALRVDEVGPRWSRGVVLDPAGRATESARVLDATGQELETLTVHRSDVADAGGYRLLIPPRQPGWAALVLADGTFVPYP